MHTRSVNSTEMDLRVYSVGCSDLIHTHTICFDMSEWEMREENRKKHCLHFTATIMRHTAAVAATTTTGMNDTFCVSLLKLISNCSPYVLAASIKYTRLMYTRRAQQ